MKTIRSFDFIAAGIDFDILEHPLDGCGGNRLNSYKRTASDAPMISMDLPVCKSAANPFFLFLLQFSSPFCRFADLPLTSWSVYNH